MIASALIGSAELVGALGVLALGLASIPRTRRVAYAVYRFGRAHMSPWMLALIGVCGMIPGPLDEIIVMPVLVVILLRTPRKRQILRRYVRTAWGA